MNWMRRAFFCRLLTRAARPHCAKERSLASFLEAVGLGLGLACVTVSVGDLDLGVCETVSRVRSVRKCLVYI